MESEFIHVVKEGPVTRLVMNRPAVHNAFNDEMIEAFSAALDAIASSDETQVVVLAGAGKSFCAGADFNWMKAMKDYTEEENLADANRLADLAERLFTLPQPTVARVHGAAIGGGTGLVAGCDFAVASQRARFGFSEVRMGLAPAVISPYLMLRMGFGNCRRLFLTGESFTADQALAYGLVDEVVDEAGLDDAVQATVEKLLQAAPCAQRACKALAREVAGLRPEACRDYTTALIAGLRTQPEAQMRMSAFLAKARAKRAAQEDGAPATPEEVGRIAENAIQQLQGDGKA